MTKNSSTKETNCVRAILYRNQGKEPDYLLLKRIPELKDVWQLVMGSIEKDESERDAVEREIYEETGIEDFEVVKRFDDIHTFESNGEVRLRTFLVKANESKVKLNQEEKEHEDWGWVSFEEAIELLDFENQRDYLSRSDDLLRRKLS